MEDNSYKLLTAALIHEIKNPISVIKVNIDYLRLTDEKKENEKSYDTIIKELEKMNKIINDFVRLDNEDKYTRKNRFEITSLINDVATEFDNSYKNILFKYDILTKPVYIEGNYSQICVVFFNIYKNAVEAVDFKGVIKTEVLYDENVIIKITDNGRGIKKEDIKNVGNAFFTTKKDGSGLGITVCKNILKRHNATFDIKNNNSEGCCVTVTFKL